MNLHSNVASGYFKHAVYESRVIYRFPSFYLSKDVKTQNKVFIEVRQD
jgi:hypothetical protein